MLESGNPLRRSLIVGLGFALAFVASVLANWAYDVRARSQPYDTSGGMYAAGEALTGIGTFLVLAIFPTLLALWFLRANEAVRRGIALGALGFALAGLAGVLSPLFMPYPATSLGGLVVEPLAQGFGVPLWVAVFASVSLLAPTPAARRTLAAAVAVGAVASVFVAIHWLVPASTI